MWPLFGGGALRHEGRRVCTSGQAVRPGVLSVAVGAGSASGAVGTVLRGRWGAWILRYGLCIFSCLGVAAAW